MTPHVLWDDGEQKFKMWYSGGEQYEPDAIGYAESQDGIHWARQPKPVFVPDRTKSWEGCKVTAPQVLQRKSDYLLFYIGFENVYKAAIGMAKSTDGFSNWQRFEQNPIISPSHGKWDASGCYKPFALRHGNKWLLWYNGRNGNVEQIGLAIFTASDLGF
jgi:predicted GH43/DUF377 family glycosyl hydrolase